MALKTILEDVQDKVQTVTGIGPVHLFFRSLMSEKEIVDAYVVDEADGTHILRPWLITREAAEARDLGPQFTRDSQRIVMHGYRAIDSAADGLEKLQTEADAVRAVWNGNPANRVATGICKYTSPCSLRVFNEVKFAGVPCWHAELVITAEER